jgi:hypothetical protein
MTKEPKRGARVAGLRGGDARVMGALPTNRLAPVRGRA